MAPGAGCTASGPTGTDARLTRPSTTFTFTRNGHSWAWALTLHADNTGRYQVTCNGSRFAVAPSPNVSGFATRLATGIVALIGGLLLGILGGTFGLIVVARRRSAARRSAGLQPPMDNR